jgi:hypothetical protein
VVELPVALGEMDVLYEEELVDGATLGVDDEARLDDKAVVEES